MRELQVVESWICRGSGGFGLGNAGILRGRFGQPRGVQRVLRRISPFRRRMTEDITIRGFAPKTQASYFRAVADFTAFLGCAF